MSSEILGLEPAFYMSRADRAQEISRNLINTALHVAERDTPEAWAAAWAIAQNDSLLDKAATQEKWEEWARKTIAARKAEGRSI